MRYVSTRIIIGLLVSVPELWLAFYLAARPWFPQWAENALFWQLLLTSVALCFWAGRGSSEYDRKRSEKDGGQP